MATDRRTNLLRLTGHAQLEVARHLIVFDLARNEELRREAARQLAHWHGRLARLYRLLGETDRPFVAADFAPLDQLDRPTPARDPGAAD